MSRAFVDEVNPCSNCIVNGKLCMTQCFPRKMLWCWECHQSGLHDSCSVVLNNLTLVPATFDPSVMSSENLLIPNHNDVEAGVNQMRNEGVYGQPSSITNQIEALSLCMNSMSQTPILDDVNGASTIGTSSRSSVFSSMEATGSTSNSTFSLELMNGPNSNSNLKCDRCAAKKIPCSGTFPCDKCNHE
ncbi:hypothetical protein BC938DRAFT_470892, partial [Jimgerdemannia flammicorona]